MPQTRDFRHNTAAARNLSTRRRHPLTQALARAMPGALLLSASLLVSSPALANTYQVSNTLDSGAGSLREAIDLANNNPGPDTITFASTVTGTISLTTGSLYIYDSTDVQGPGASVLSIDGSTIVSPPPVQGTGQSPRTVFLVAPESQATIASVLSGNHTLGGPPPAIDVTFAGLTIAGGHGLYGGGIAAIATHLTVRDCVVSNNTAEVTGGGIFSATKYGSLNVVDSVISNNSVAGGNIQGGSPLIPGGGGISATLQDTTILRSTISGNSAPAGGGIMAKYQLALDHPNTATNGTPVPTPSTLTITDSTLSGNQTNAAPPDPDLHFGTTNATDGSYYFAPVGGGALSIATNVAVSNSTFSGNSAVLTGGGLAILTGGDESVTIGNSTFTGNQSGDYGGGIALALNGTASPVISNSVIGGNSATNGQDDISIDGANPGGPPAVNMSYSLLQTPAASGINDLVGNIFNQAPMLGPLTNNGGTTRTQLPLAGSPLIDAGDPAYSGASFDQRGTPYERIANGRVDIGATEFGAGKSAGGGAFSYVAVPGLGWLGKLGLGGLLSLLGLAMLRRRNKTQTAVHD